MKLSDRVDLLEKKVQEIMIKLNRFEVLQYIILVSMFGLKGAEVFI